MACRGSYTAFEPELLTHLLAAGSDEDVVDVACEIERATSAEWRHETDKSWDALHRCLGDGTLVPSVQFLPLSAAVLGGEQLTRGSRWVISLVRPERVRTVADALGEVTREWLRRRYDAIDPKVYEGTMGDEDFEYTWCYFGAIPDLFDRSAHAGRAVMFIVDL
jgi:hypothetical protein